MDEKTEKLIKQTPIADAEKMFGGKHWSQFNDLENLLMLNHAFSAGEVKDAHLKFIGDTHFRMTWGEFKGLIEQHGFVLGLKYDFEYTAFEPRTEEFIIYYHPGDGLVICATSFGSKTSVNGGNLYGEIKANNRESCEGIWDWMSTGGCFDQENLLFTTSHDVREGLFSKLDELRKYGTFQNRWKDKRKFIWLLDYVEVKVLGYDWKQISKEKLSRCPKELQKIVGKL